MSSFFQSEASLIIKTQNKGHIFFFEIYEVPNQERKPISYPP